MNQHGFSDLLKVHARYDGEGDALNGDECIARVHYALKDVEEQLSRTDDTLQTVLRGERGIFGLLRTPHARLFIDWVGHRLTLRLEDGRSLPFTVVKVLDRNSCLLQGLGSIS